jgi:uncharacterized damage-inducible protein DinB
MAARNRGPQPDERSHLVDSFRSLPSRRVAFLQARYSEVERQLKMMGRLQFEKPRAAVFRDFTLSHLIHHRGQFSVYLRLLNVPVPGSYGPSADEQA